LLKNFNFRRGIVEVRSLLLFLIILSIRRYSKRAFLIITSGLVKSKLISGLSLEASKRMILTVLSVTIEALAALSSLLKTQFMQFTPGFITILYDFIYKVYN
jgi:hypothetical protein